MNIGSSASIYFGGTLGAGIGSRQFVPPAITAFRTMDRLLSALETTHVAPPDCAQQRFIDNILEIDGLAAQPGPVTGDDDLALGIV